MLVSELKNMLPDDGDPEVIIASFEGTKKKLYRICECYTLKDEKFIIFRSSEVFYCDVCEKFNKGPELVWGRCSCHFERLKKHFGSNGLELKNFTETELMFLILMDFEELSRTQILEIQTLGLIGPVEADKIMIYNTRM